jgi:hypothetical protein
MVVIRVHTVAAVAAMAAVAMAAVVDTISNRRGMPWRARAATPP